MKKIIDFKDNRGVMSLIVILGIGFFVLAIVLTLTGQIVVEIMRNRNTIAGDQSFFTAEAAAREGVYQYLATTTYTGGTPELINDVSEGSISVTSSILGVAHKDIIGTAKNNLTNRKVIYTVFFEDGLAFEYAAFSSSTINLTGQISICGDTFSNGSTSVSGAAEIDGDASAVGTVTGSVTGSKNEGEDPINFPEINIDFDEYKTEAIIAGTLYTDVGDLADDLRNVNSSGIFFASTTDPVSINGPNTYLLGSLVTLGDLTIVNNQKFESTGGYEAVVVAGDFTMTGGEIEGNVYVGGDFELHGGKIKGIVYVKGGATVGAGNWTIEGALISSEEIDLRAQGDGEGIVYDSEVLASWFDFITITNPPEIKSWREE